MTVPEARCGREPPTDRRTKLVVNFGNALAQAARVGGRSFRSAAEQAGVALSYGSACARKRLLSTRML
jgi:cysteine sulfinate desulfinase/cysteine desulfurase-like protein